VKKIITIAARMTPVFLALAMFCSNPVDKDVKWRSSVDFPLTANKKFFLGAMMDTLFFNHQQVQRSVSKIDTTPRVGLPNLYDTTYDTTMMILKAYPLYDSIAKHPIPDTVAFGFPTHDTATDTITEDSLADKYYEDVFGPIPLSGAPATVMSISLPAGTYPGGTAVPVPSSQIKLKWIYHLELRDTAQFVNVTLTNNSSANFSQVSMTLGTLGTATIVNLNANSSATAQYSAQAKVIDSIITVTASFTPSGLTTITAGDNISASLSFDSLYANKVVVLDSMLASYKRTFTNEYNLTDTVDVDYIDISKGFFNYYVTNHTNVQMQIAVTHRNLWRTDYCQGHLPPLITVNDLGSLTLGDSDVAYGGEVTPHTARVDFPPGQVSRFSKSNISGYRMFPEWNPVTKKSVTKVDYFIYVQVNDKPVTLSAGDSLEFVIKTTSFKFSEMYGRSMEPYHRTSDLSTIPVKLPWSKAVTDSLRGNFVLNKVLAEVGTRMAIPAGAFIDTVKVVYEISSATDPTIKCSDSAVLTHVMRDSLYHRPIIITPVVNNYPDSVKVKVSLSIPVGTTIKAVNDLTDATDPAYPKYIGRMVIHGQVDYNLVAPLCWTVADTTVMDLGGTQVDLGGANGVMGPFVKMSDRTANINIIVTNFTNVYLKLYALLATDSTKVELLAPKDTADTLGGRYITTNQLTNLINHPLPGYVDLLGNGLLIPPRDSTKTKENVIALTEQDLSQILNAKKIGLRWEVRFIPQPAGGIVPDALSNTDWMKLNSWIHIDGVNSIDSLFNK
jgi:hypothetical protein